MSLDVPVILFHDFPSTQIAKIDPVEAVAARQHFFLAVNFFMTPTLLRKYCFNYKVKEKKFFFFSITSFVWRNYILPQRLSTTVVCGLLLRRFRSRLLARRLSNDQLLLTMRNRVLKAGRSDGLSLRVLVLVLNTAIQGLH